MQGRYDGTPHPSVLREAMQQKHRLTLRRTAEAYLEIQTSSSDHHAHHNATRVGRTPVPILTPIPTTTAQSGPGLLAS